MDNQEYIKELRSQGENWLADTITEAVAAEREAYILAIEKLSPKFHNLETCACGECMGLRGAIEVIQARGEAPALPEERSE